MKSLVVHELLTVVHKKHQDEAELEIHHNVGQWPTKVGLSWLHQTAESHRSSYGRT